MDGSHHLMSTATLAIEKLDSVLNLVQAAGNMLDKDYPHEHIVLYQHVRVYY